jgi:hypothetical protein
METTRRTISLTTVVLVLVASFTSDCATTNNVFPPATYAEACANIASLGCYEGTDPSCAPLMQRAQEARITDLKPSCLAAARSVGEVQACGTVSCTASDQAVAATCPNACATLKRLGCPEAAGCLDSCTKVTKTHLTDLDLACVVKAKTQAQVRSCRSVSCQ